MYWLEFELDETEENFICIWVGMLCLNEGFKGFSKVTIVHFYFYALESSLRCAIKARKKRMLQ